MHRVKVADHPNLVRDQVSGAIIDVDTEAFQRYALQKEQRLRQQQQITQLEERINNFENNLNDIKHLLQQLLDK